VRLDDGGIRLRPRTEADVPTIVAACQDPEIARWTEVPSRYTEEDARRFVREYPDALASVASRTDELLGTVGWRRLDRNVQVGWELDPPSDAAPPAG
jgi:RimJ/RimL family protein N-acetyltransferase